MFCQVGYETNRTNLDLLTMATCEITIPDKKIQEVLQRDRGMAALLEPIQNQILQAEMTDHLGASTEERTDDRRGYRNGSYQRKRHESRNA